MRRQHEAALVEQEASLRRVAAIVAEGTASADVFATIAREAAQLLRITGVHIWRYERDGTGTVVGAWSERSDPFQPGTNWPFETPSVAACPADEVRPSSQARRLRGGRRRGRRCRPRERDPFGHRGPDR